MPTVTVRAARRDVWTIGLVSVAHGTSHFFQLVVPALFPFLVDAFATSYTALATGLLIFYAVSGVAQTSAGFLVDRYGARPVLLGGLALYAGAIALIGLAPSLWVLYPLLALAGAGNSVFHPADFALLSAKVDRARLGRAFSFHGVAGNLGWVLAPGASVGLAALFGWRAALLILGGIGVALVLVLASRRELADDAAAVRRRQLDTEQRPPLAESLRALAARPILMCFSYFALVAVASVGLQTFAIPSMMQLYSVDIALATGSLTAYLVGAATGTLSGGVLADRTARHGLVAGSGLVAGASGIALVGSGALPPFAILPVLAAAGFAVGLTLPSRDLLVRAATPPGSSGKTFGFVYSGLDLGSALAPMLFGWLIDLGQPRGIYATVVVAMLLAVATVQTLRRPRPVAAPAE